ncbi:glucosamine-6-phosphate deaminase [Nosocomiicoccus ampullae]|uniref:Glucosamine-6-phosphate deaminase n=1 Tax=Nosocomiicoccus ampullae TaxID=489910 RepID=A0A9Q2D0H7_9STAP|nr:glucosamine-6-phosphate deaminase [Nosocomiicoccus ampullae]MBB5176515.1 glucosamine-6-phosphate deaminase [Nosocomiicoccus ampullae]QYA46553.1 glucosamine-6-phosphate deaminase [Nosocomiicoccus ampullae]QYA48137.1 glucosamine-6-phosphate deaminase [Nosocomiicoccus ampullae]
MTNFKEIKTKTYEDMSREAAQIIFDALKENETFSLGLATGSTPEGMYEVLATLINDEKLDLSHLTTFNLDEYVGLDEDDDQSYHYFMDEHLFSKLDIPKENINILNGVASDLDKEVKEYESLIDETGIDIQVLGIGRNGHIAFNEPGTSFESLTGKVQLTDETIEDNSRFFEKKEDVPTEALSMGLKTIMKAKQIILLISGDNKQRARELFVSGKVSEDVPASILHNHDNVILITDEAARGEE